MAFPRPYFIILVMFDLVYLNSRFGHDELLELKGVDREGSVSTMFFCESMFSMSHQSKHQVPCNSEDVDVVYIVLSIYVYASMSFALVITYLSVRFKRKITFLCETMGIFWDMDRCGVL